MISQRTLFPVESKILKDDSNQRYTPKKYLALVERSLGWIDLDPTSNPAKTVPAQWHMTEADNCLTTDWTTFCDGHLPVTIFMNPPYSNAHPFIARLCEYLEFDNNASAITLTHSSLIQTKTSQHYFKKYAKAICLPNHRINFDYPDGMEQKSGNDRDSLWTYWGQSTYLSNFVKTFESQGMICQL